MTTPGGRHHGPSGGRPDGETIIQILRGIYFLRKHEEQRVKNIRELFNYKQWLAARAIKGPSSRLFSPQLHQSVDKHDSDKKPPLRNATIANSTISNNKSCIAGAAPDCWRNTWWASEKLSGEVCTNTAETSPYANEALESICSLMALTEDTYTVLL